MTNFRSRHLAIGILAIGTAGLTIVPAQAGAVVTKTSGTGQNMNLSWTEYDPDDLLGLPGNVHIGYLYADSGPYGTYVSGNVTDFECEEGESPYGGHGLNGHVVDEGGEIVAAATDDAIDDIIDGGGTTIEADVVADAIQTELNDGVTDVIADEIEEEFPACEYLGDRFLNGEGTTTVTVDTNRQVAKIVGTLTVSNGGHGEPGSVLGSPPIDVTITGGEWNRYEYSSSFEGPGYKYRSWQKGLGYNGGTVTGGIGAMGFADDADDQSFGDFGSYRYRTVDRVR